MNHASPDNPNHQELRRYWADVVGTASETGHENMMQLIQLRWIAVLGQISMIAVATLVLDIRLPLPSLLKCLACLIAFNLASHLRWHERKVASNGELFFALLVDVVALTIQLYLSGGTTNPFAFLYLLQIILSAVLLERWSTWSIVAITSICLAGLSLFYVPLPIPPDYARGLSSLYVQGMLICFGLIAALLVFFMNRIQHNLRVGDAQLAALRQRTIEEEHIVRMGLLASGAAHELGTPLATLSVILGDWKRMPQFRQDADLAQELEDMQAQLQRCKSIVSGILLSAGEARGEMAVKTSINAFLQDLVEEWRDTRTPAAFDYDNRIANDVSVASDTAIKQMIYNLLDNALEASPEWVAFSVERDVDTLRLQILDKGPGFSEAIRAQIGKPYQSTKGRAGSGLGLFFVVNVVRKLGGTLSVQDRAKTGACVQLEVPLAAISLGSEDDDAHD